MFLWGVVAGFAQYLVCFVRSLDVFKGDTDVRAQSRQVLRVFRREPEQETYTAETKNGRAERRRQTHVRQDSVRQAGKCRGRHRACTRTTNTDRSATDIRGNTGEHA